MTEESKSIRRASRAGMAFGVLVMLAGVFTIAMPHVGGVAATVVVAGALIVAGLVETVFAFGAPSFGRGVLAFLFGAISVVAGVVIFANPTFGLTTLTIAVIAYFIVDGLYHLVAFFRLTEVRGRGWFLFGGLISLALAIMLSVDFPSSAEWAIGLLVGIRLLMTGWMMIVMGGVTHRAARKMTRA